MSYETAVIRSLPTSAPASSKCVVQGIHSTYRLRSAPHLYMCRMEGVSFLF